MFENAVRMKLRFNFRGLLNVEDLWDLSVENLDSIYQGLHSKTKEQKSKSLLRKKNKKDAVLELQVNIVKHIVTVKLVEQKERENAALRASRKQTLLQVLEKKQYATLEEMSEEEIQELISEL